MKRCRPREFAELIGKSVQTLQRWHRERIPNTHRSKTNRRYYTHEQYLEYVGQKATPDKKNNSSSDLSKQRRAREEFCCASEIAVSE